jgi:hypothetical protein
MRPSVEVAHIEGYRYGCADPHDTQPTTRVHRESGTLVWRPFAPVWSFSVGRRVAGSLLLGAFTGRALSTVLGAKDRVIVSATA